MFSFVLYGCETWSVILREEHRLRVLEIGVLRRTFWTKKGEVTGDCRRLRDEQLHGLYPPNIIRELKRKRKMARHRPWACLGERRGAYRVSVGKPEGKISLGRPRRRWEDNIKMDLKEVGWGTWTVDLA
jgi:hypothetical protein